MKICHLHLEREEELKNNITFVGKALKSNLSYCWFVAKINIVLVLYLAHKVSIAAVHIEEAVYGLVAVAEDYIDYIVVLVVVLIVVHKHPVVDCLAVDKGLLDRKDKRADIVHLDLL